MRHSAILRFIILRNGPAASGSSLYPSSISVSHIHGGRRSLSTTPDGGVTPTTTSTSAPSVNEVDSLLKAVDEKKDVGSSEGRKATISKAMQAYLKRAKENQEFMDKQEKEFVFGRRHLANMMGKDPETFTQQDIDEAIRYLFPSGLYAKAARPMMRPPTEIYPKQKAAQFDMSGRPHHPFFYTAKPNFYFLLHQMVGKLNSLNQIESGRSDVDLSSDSLLAGSVWISKDDLEQRLMEKVNDQMYNEFIACMERLASHPKKEKEIDFIKSYRTELTKQGKTETLPPVNLEPDGRKSVHVPECWKKSARADVLVTVPGTGEFKINGKGLDYFPNIKARSTVISPLQLVGWLGKCDVEAHTEGGYTRFVKKKDPKCEEKYGEMCRAICVRYGIATALAALGADYEKLRLAGYLTPDRRRNERKKPGHVGARAAWTWKKR